MDLKDFFCGMSSGTAQIILGQPFDFLKVKIQTLSSGSQNIPALAKDIYHEFGLRGFYRGASSIFLGTASTIGVEFLVYEWAKRLMFTTFGNRQGKYDLDKLKMWEVGVAGAIVGWTVAFIYCPVEYVKIQKQLSHTMSQSSVALLLKELRANGIRNIYKGYWATTLRQSYGAVFFYTIYESIVRWSTAHCRKDAQFYSFMMAGAAAGFSFHLLTYPIDIFKTNLQRGTDWKSALSMALQLQRLKGYKVVLTRAMIVNSAGFTVYQKAQQAVSNMHDLHSSLIH